MGAPPQPELRCSGRGATDHSSARGRVDTDGRAGRDAGSVPPDNAPGHRPEEERDRPGGPP